MTATSLRDPRARRPSARHPGWQYLGERRGADGTIALVYERGRVRVLSSLAHAELPDGSGIGPQWHVSISRGAKRPSAKEVARALRAFGMEGAEEDNHHPGVARHFWLPLDPAHRVDCECKATEQTIVEPDGYRWTNPAPGEGVCRGCEYERISGRPCALHVGADARTA